MRGSAIVCTSLSLVLAAPAQAAAPDAKIGFSKLIVRLDGQADIGVAGPGHEVRILERMRAKGFQAVGAENLVFGKDDSHQAQFLVGGTVRELECVHGLADESCRIGVEWQVLDVDSDQVVYSVMSRAAVLHMSKTAQIGSLLLDAALDRLLARPGFRKVLATAATPKADVAPPLAQLEACTGGKKLPDGADDLLRATVVVKVPGGHGSGFFVAPNYLLTAAHVVSAGAPQVVLRDGTTAAATTVRVARRMDVALLRTTAASGCVRLGFALPKVGADAFVAGAPGPLAVSLTRGIVSGIPTIDGLARIQTDAPVNPGNSGGPLADANGDVIGLVSFKLTGGKVEGLGFAVPVRNALDALGLTMGPKTDESLAKESAPPKVTIAPIKDTPDETPSLDPEGDARRAAEAEKAGAEEQARKLEEERDKRTPAYVVAMKWGGLTIATGGVIALASTYTAYRPGGTTERQFASLRTWNTVGWAALGLGVGAFFVSFYLRPPLSTTTVAVQLGPGALGVGGTF